MANFGTTVKYALRYLLGTSSVNDIDAGFQALAEDLDPKLTPFDSGLFADRPPSSPAQPGKAGREYLATDRGVLYKDYGTGWIALNEEIGNVSWRSTDTIPPGGTHVEANGQAISRAAYPLYMSLIGTKHGAGDGSTTVNVPDAGGRVLVGRDVGAIRIPNSPRAVGQSGGEERHPLTIPEMPSHTHGPGSGTSFVNTDTSANAAATSPGVDHIVTAFRSTTTGATGGGGAHNNMQPYLVLLPLVRVA